jgi:hypothetical protein
MDAVGSVLVLEEFRKRADEAGRGYQTMMNEALRQFLGKTSHPLDESTLRCVLREELKTQAKRGR